MPPDTGRPLRMLLLAVHSPNRSPSQRFRIEEFLPWLRDRGIETDYAWALSNEAARVFYGRVSAAQKARVSAAACAGQLSRSLPGLLRGAYDVVFVQREAFFLGGPWLERLAASRAPLLFDFDDAIWIHAVSAANRRFGFLKNTRKIPQLARMADTVLAGNEYLATWARQHNSRVVVLPTTVDTERFAPASHQDDGKRPVVIGWTGSPSTLAHFDTVVPALLRVKQRLGDRVTFRVIGDPSYREPRLGLVGERWSADTEVEDVGRFDVGLMPLPDDEWAKGKCGLKGLQYLSMGIPALLSPVGVNTEIITPGVDGFLPKTEGEWVDTLCALAEDPELRRRVGEAGRKTAVERYSVIRWRATYEDVIRAAAARR